MARSVGLPAGGKMPWPPPAALHAYARYAEHSAWYDGSPLALSAFYGGYGGSQLGGQAMGFFNQNLTYPEPTDSSAPLWRRFMFWARLPTAPVSRMRLHVPIAADIAATSADLLFSEAPDIRIPAAHLQNADGEAKTIQARLAQLASDGGFYTTVLEAAEVGAALGGVYLRVGWDKALMGQPFVTAVHADAVVPEFLWGRLQAATLWRIVHQDANRVWRHLERHEPGVVYHGLYQGTARELGERIPLTESPMTADLSVDLVDGDMVETGIDRLLVAYVPNMRPNRSDRGSSLGRSDYAGVESLMDALDETYSSWMRDIRLGRARLIVPREMLKTQGRGEGADFDLDREIWVKADVDPSAEHQITENQFQIRTQDHADTASNLVERVIAGAGYSGSTFGLHGEGPIKTATEIAAREQRSLVTRGKKAQYWAPALSYILETILMVDQLVFDGPGVMTPRIDFSDSVRDDPKETATTVGLLLAAQAASAETRVRMVHPDWGDDEVAEEVRKILVQSPPATVPDIPGLSGGTPAPAGHQPNLDNPDAGEPLPGDPGQPMPLGGAST